MSSTFCNFPWRHLYVETNGHKKICCMPDQYLEKQDGYRHYTMYDGLLAGWNSDYMKNIRLSMLNGKKLRECNKCYDKEERGIPSLRTLSLNGAHAGEIVKHFDEYKAMTNADGSVNTMPHDIELHFGNVCNLKCKMCSTFFSHMIGKELLNIKKDDPSFFQWIQRQGGHVNNWSTGDLSEVFDWYKDPAVKTKVFNEINDHVERVNVIGGEPTVIPEFWELLQFLSRKGTLKNKHIKLVTNGTNTNPRLMEWFAEAKSVEIMVSIDAVEERNKYIRFPADWDTLLKNLEFYKQLCAGDDDKKYYISPSPQILNIDQLADIHIYFEKLGHPVAINPKVTGPTICDYEYFPFKFKQQVKEKLLGQLGQIQDEERTRQILPYIDTLDTDYGNKLYQKHTMSAFVKYNDYMDKFRKTDSWRDLMPDLAEAIEEIL